MVRNHGFTEFITTNATNMASMAAKNAKATGAKNGGIVAASDMVPVPT